MSSHSLKESIALEAELSKLHLKMRECATDVEFQSLQTQHCSILNQLTLLRKNSPTSSLFKEGQESSLLNTPPERPLLDSESKNLQAVSWYLNRVSDKVDELNLNSAQYFKKVAQEASEAVEEVIKLLNS